MKTVQLEILSSNWQTGLQFENKDKVFNEVGTDWDRKMKDRKDEIVPEWSRDLFEVSTRLVQFDRFVPVCEYVD